MIINFQYFVYTLIITALSFSKNTLPSMTGLHLRSDNVKKEPLEFLLKRNIKISM